MGSLPDGFQTALEHRPATTEQVVDQYLAAITKSRISTRGCRPPRPIATERKVKISVQSRLVSSRFKFLPATSGRVGPILTPTQAYVCK